MIFIHNKCFHLLSLLFVWLVYTDGSYDGHWCSYSYGVRPALMEPCDE